MNIIYVKTAKAKGYTALGIARGEEKLAYTVADSVYRQIGSPRPSDAVDDNALMIIERADFEYRAKRKALNLLAYGDNSMRTLYNKLVRYGIPKSIADSTVREMVRLGYVDEDRTLRRIIADEVNLRYTGPMKLSAMLTAKGYSREKVKNICDELSSIGAIDFDEAKRSLIEKRLPENAEPEEIKKFLYKNGYSTC